MPPTPSQQRWRLLAATTPASTSGTCRRRRSTAASACTASARQRVRRTVACPAPTWLLEDAVSGHRTPMAQRQAVQIEGRAKELIEAPNFVTLATKRADDS